MRNRALVLAGLAALSYSAAVGAETPKWSFDKNQAQLTYTVTLEHEEKRNVTDKTTLDLTLAVKLENVAEDGSAQWSIAVRDLRVRRQIDKKKHKWDSKQHKGKEPAHSIRWLAGLAAKEIKVTVGQDGKLKKLEGAAKSVPHHDFMLGGADLDEVMGQGLLNQVLVCLFRHPSVGKGYAYGALSLLGRSVCGNHLVQTSTLKKEKEIRHDNVLTVKREWTAVLVSDGGSMSAGGKKLTLRGGEIGKGKGSGIYAPGYLISLDESVKYEHPTPTRMASFKRRLRIALAKSK